MRPDDSVSHRIRSFHPAQVDPQVWAEIGPIVRSLVEAADLDRPARATDMLNALTQLFVWGRHKGYGLDPALLLTPTIIEEFAARGLPHLAPPSRANYRSLLRAAARANLPYEQAPTRGIPTPRFVSGRSIQRRRARRVVELGVGDG